MKCSRLVRFVGLTLMYATSIGVGWSIGNSMIDVAETACDGCGLGAASVLVVVGCGFLAYVDDSR